MSHLGAGKPAPKADSRTARAAGARPAAAAAVATNAAAVPTGAAAASSAPAPPPLKKHASAPNQSNSLRSPSAAAAAASSSFSAQDHEGDVRMGAKGQRASSSAASAAVVSPPDTGLARGMQKAGQAAAFKHFLDEQKREFAKYSRPAGASSSSASSSPSGALESSVRDWGLQLLPDHRTLIRSQGDCLLDSVLYTTQVREGKLSRNQWIRCRDTLANELRAKLISWLADNAEFRTPVGPLSLLRFNMNESWPEMCARLSKPGEWLETPALQAVATVLGRDVAVFLSTTRRSGGMTAFFASGSSNQRSPTPPGPLVLANFHLMHFVPVVEHIEEWNGTEGAQEEADAHKKALSLWSAPRDSGAATGSSSACAWVAEQFVQLLAKIEELESKLRACHPPMELGLDLCASQIRSMQSMLDSEFVIGILGTNGVGKSFLLNILLYVTMMEAEKYAKQPDSAVQLESWAELVADAMEGRGETHAALLAIHKAWSGSILDYLLKDSTQKELKQCNVVVQQMSEAEQAKRLQVAVRKQEAEVFDEILRSFHSLSGDRDASLLRAYLLPSMDIGQVTTKCLIRIKYGQRFQVLVRYLSESEAKETAFQLVSLIQEMQGPDLLSDADMERVKASLPVAMQQFKMLTGIHWTQIQLNKRLKAAWPQTAPLREWRDEAKLENVTSDYTLPKTADDIVLSSSIQPVLGRSLLLVGRGSCDVDVDRTWIRDQLDLLLFGCTRELVQRGNSSDWHTQVQADKCLEAHAIASITLFVPAGVLESGLCLLDMPGTNEKNAMSEMRTKQGMDESNVLLLLTLRALNADMLSHNLLAQSSFLRDAIALSRAPVDDAASAGLASVSLSACLPVPQFGQLVHAHCFEKTQPVPAKKLFDLLSATYEDMPVTSLMHDVLVESAKDIRQTLMQVFSAQRAAAQAAAAADDSDDDDESVVLTPQQQADFEAAVGKCTQLAVYPSMFTSVAECSDETLGLPAPSDENRARLLRATGLGRLLGKLRNTGVRQAVYLLEQVCSTGQPSTRTDNTVQDTLELSASEDDDGDDCKMNAQGEPAAAASASSPSSAAAVVSSPRVQPLLQGPIPRLLRELRSVVADRGESEPSRVQDEEDRGAGSGSSSPPKEGCGFERGALSERGPETLQRTSQGCRRAHQHVV